jgi:hypothetical protein
MNTPIKSIRLKCLDCCCGSHKEVELCHIEDCSLHPYRFGKRPTTPRKNSYVKKIEGEIAP